MATELSPDEWIYRGLTTHVVTHRAMVSTEEIKYTKEDVCSLVTALKQEDGKASRIRSVSLKGLWTLGDVNKDDVVDLTDVAVLLDKITENESVSLSTGDINGDGVVDMTDVSVLLDTLTEK